MELMNLKELAKRTDRAVATLKRHADKGTIPTEAGLTDEQMEAGYVYGESAVDFVLTLRKNTPRKPREEEEPSEMDVRVEAVKNASIRAATGAAITFLRHEIESARAGKEHAYEARLHREIADMLDGLAEQPETAEPEVTA